MLKNSKICLISVTLKSWSGRKLSDPTTYILRRYISDIEHTLDHMTKRGSVILLKMKKRWNSKFKLDILMEDDFIHHKRHDDAWQIWCITLHTFNFLRYNREHVERTDGAGAIFKCLLPDPSAVMLSSRKLLSLMQPLRPQSCGLTGL